MGRAFQVRMVKDSASAEPESFPRDNFEEHASIVATHINKVVKSVTLGVFGYVILDTVRKVIVNGTDK